MGWRFPYQSALPLFPPLYTGELLDFHTRFSRKRSFFPKIRTIRSHIWAPFCAGERKYYELPHHGKDTKIVHFLEILPLFCPSTASKLGKMLTFLAISSISGCERALQPTALKSTTCNRGIAASGAQIDHLFDSIWTLRGSCKTRKSDPPRAKNFVEKNVVLFSSSEGSTNSPVEAGSSPR